MEQFRYVRVHNLPELFTRLQQETTSESAKTRLIAGGTSLLDLMKLGVEGPRTLIDVNRVGFSTIEETRDGGLRIGALVRNSDLAHHAGVRERYPVLSEAILSGASAQLRNMATTAGNLLQRTRCAYFRNPAMRCNKRDPGSGCSAIPGENRTMAVLGGSDSCVAVFPSDMAVAMLALDARIRIQGAHGERIVPIADFHLLPGSTPHRENVLEVDEVVTEVELPPLPKGTFSGYLKLRDRASYEFALASAAIVLSYEGRRVSSVRICLGGVGTKPWRAWEAEKVLSGQELSQRALQGAADVALRNAQPLSQNAFKIELAKRCIVHALRTVSQMGDA